MHLEAFQFLVHLSYSILLTHEHMKCTKTNCLNVIHKH